jgi:hypothetical protein
MEKYTPTDQELKEVLMAQPYLAMQSFDTLKTEISPVTHELMSRQATINIGKNSMFYKKVLLVMSLMVRQQ